MNKPRSGNIIIITLLISLLASVSVAGYLFWQNKQLKQQAQQQTTTFNQSEQVPFQSPPPKTFTPQPHQIIAPESIDTAKLIPSNMNFKEVLYADFNGDGQKEIILVGTNKNHLAPFSFGGPRPTVLLVVFQYLVSSNSWNKVKEVNYQNFPTDDEAITVYKVNTINLSGGEGLVVTYYGSGSRVNFRFFTLVGSNNTINFFNFPDNIYKAGGGILTPQAVSVEPDGTVTTKEGIYKETDANCCPTEGTLTGIFKVRHDGIALISVTKGPNSL